MNPNENDNEFAGESQSQDSLPPDIVEAEIVPQAVEPIATNPQAAIQTSKPSNPGYGNPQQPYKLPEPKPPYLRQTIIAKVCFAIAIAASVGFLILYGIYEFQVRPDGLPIIQQALWIVIALIISVIGFTRVHRRYVPDDVRWSASTAFTLSLISYLFFFPEKWKWICVSWVAIHLLPIIGNAFAPKQDVTEIKFNVNDSISANGGSLAALVLGGWSIFGALFTNLSIINSILGIALGLWGLSSRKKFMATVGIGLCVLGILACMMNTMYYFWEIVRTPQEELMNSAE